MASDLAEGVESGCTTLKCAPAPAMSTPRDDVALMVSLNGQYDSAAVVATLVYYDNEAVAVSNIAPVAGPIAGGTPIQVRGSGFADLGGAACILTLQGGAMVFLHANVAGPGLMVCTPSAGHAGMAGTASGARVSIVLNGDPSTRREAAVVADRTFYFVDLGAIRITKLTPPAGPIGGDTTVLLMGSGLGTPCGGGLCPDPPTCIFELQTFHIAGAVAAAAAAASSSAATNGAFNVSVVGKTVQRSGTWAVLCDVPPSGFTSEDATNIPIPPAALVTSVRVAILGYLPATPAEPTTLLQDKPTFRYYDAATKSVHPRGGPPSGGTSITISGRSLTTGFLGDQYPAAHGYRTVFSSARCVFLASPPHGYGSTIAPSIVAVATAALAPGSNEGDDAPQLTCTTPGFTLPDAGAGVAAVYVEVALNGYIDEHTRSTVTRPPTFTFYAATISRVHPLGGPTAGGTLLTLFGTNLADYGGALCKFTFRGADAVADGGGGGGGAGGNANAGASLAVSVDASISTGDGHGDGSAVCKVPSAEEGDRAEILATHGGLPTSVSVQLSLNGVPEQAAEAEECDAAATSGGALLADVMLARNLTSGNRRARCFAYFNGTTVRIDEVLPRGGPHTGGTSLTVRGSGFHDFGGLGCLLGELERVPATSTSDREVRCAAPRNGPLPSTGRTSVRITLNAADASPTRPMRWRWQRPIAQRVARLHLLQRRSSSGHARFARSGGAWAHTRHHPRRGLP